MGRSPTPRSRDENNIKRGAWTPEEDQQLINYIQTHGHECWTSVSKHAGLKRNGKSCRLRWKNYLQPHIKRGKFSLEEENIILQLHSIIGNKWSKIANGLPGRTDNEIKNYWNTHMKKKLVLMGIDPTTHQPTADLSSCLLQLLLLRNHLAQNFQHFTLLLQTIIALSNPVNSGPHLQEETPGIVNESPLELNPENVGITQFHLGNSSVTQTLQDVSFMNSQTNDDHHVIGHDQSIITCVNSSSSTSVIPPFMDTKFNIAATSSTTGSFDNGTDISYGGTIGDVGSSSYNWLENLFNDSVVDENIREVS